MKVKLYVCDNIGFIYAVLLIVAKLMDKKFWVSIKIKIKIFDDKIYLINQG